MNKKDILKKEYYKNRTRIQRFVRSVEKRGYTFEENILPKIPKRITEGSIRRLAKITPDYLYRKSTYTTPTGNTVIGRAGRNIEREEAGKKGAITRARKKQELQSNLSRWYREQELRKQIAEAQRELDALKNTHETEHDADYFTDYDGDYWYEDDYDYWHGEKEEIEEPKQERIAKAPHERYYAESDYEEGQGHEADEVEDGLVTLRELTESIESWTPSANWSESLIAAKKADRRSVSNVLDAAIAELGEKQVVKNVQAHGEELKELLNHVLYDSGSREGNFKDGRTQVNADIKRFQELLLGHTISQQEAMKTQELIERLHHFEEV